MLVNNVLQQSLNRRLEEDFYSEYDWCLNPLLSLDDLFHRLAEEFVRWKWLKAEWQRSEATINLYLHVCAITCIVDDYLARRRIVLSPLKTRFPRLRVGFSLIERCVNRPFEQVWRFRDRAVILWREQWGECVNQVCDILASQDHSWDSRVVELDRRVNALSGILFPQSLRSRRMKVIEGFRCQDLTHHDVFTMVDRFVALHRRNERPLVILGPRTAGAYFAPLAKAYCQALGWKDVSWLTLRPKRGISHAERRQLRKLLKRDSLVLVLDDYPNTGGTIDRMVNLLSAMNVKRERITMVIPVHPVSLNKTFFGDHLAGVKILTINPAEIYKEWLLNPQAAESMIREYVGNDGHQKVRLLQSAEVDEINSRLREHYADGFHVRLKRVYEIEVTGEGLATEVRRVFAKSVGWGWLGYHSYIVGKRLKAFVPRVIGLRDGILLTEWIDGESQENAEAPIPVLSSYIAARVKNLHLKEEPSLKGPEYGWGWLEARALLRKVFGNWTGYLKDGMLMNELKARVRVRPTFIDGRMKPEDWIQGTHRTVKVDFEHHNFGAPQLDLADPAYDLAAAVFEFALSDQSERDLVKNYEDLTKDSPVHDRLLLQKLIYGSVTRRLSTEAMIREPSSKKTAGWNNRSAAAHDFLVFTMNRFCSNLLKPAPTVRWTPSLFFLDLDGVFDTEVLGFPHTTLSGLESLEVLQANGFSVVLNTGRSIGHVRQYCSDYSLPGGIAEYGSVFFDHVTGQEISLMDSSEAEQMKHCRRVASALPGVLLDPGYRYAIRAYRMSEKGAEGLKTDEVDRFLRRYRYDALTSICRNGDTYIVGKKVNKGSAIQALKQSLKLKPTVVLAVGDSDEDVPMLLEASTAYAPSNCSEGVRRLAREGKCRILRQPHQRGLRAAVRHAVPDGHGLQRALHIPSPGAGTIADMMVELLRIAELSRTQRIAVALKRRLS